MSEALQPLPSALEKFIEALGNNPEEFIGEISTLDIITGGVWWRIQRKKALQLDKEEETLT